MQNTNACQPTLIVLLSTCALAAMLVGRTGASTTGSKDPTIREAFLAHTTEGVGAGIPTKLCSAIHVSNWRETVAVPGNWRMETCHTFARSLGATQYQVGCANHKSFSWGNAKGSVPAENECGW